MVEPPVLFGHWERFTIWLFGVTARFPKSVRGTLTRRIEDTVLDVHRDLVVARYRPRDRQEVLDRINLRIETMRLLFRVAFERRMLDGRTFEKAVTELDATGRMVGGWRKAGDRPDR